MLPVRNNVNFTTPSRILWPHTWMCTGCMEIVDESRWVVRDNDFVKFSDPWRNDCVGQEVKF